MPPGNDLSAARDRIRSVYDPETLRTCGHRLIDMLADHLTAAEAGRNFVLPWRSPADNVDEASEMADACLPKGANREALVERFGQLAGKMLDRGLNLHDPRYVGHQVPASVPLAGLFDALGAVTNQVMAIYEMGPWATAAEWAMVDKLGQRVGWKSGEFSGLVTHGGSLANFTALLTARNVALNGSWETGLPRAPRQPVMLVHADAHYGVSRSAGMIGLGTENVLRVPLDAKRRMCPQRLHEMLRDLRERGTPVAAVVACACATPIGAFDPLAEIAAVCQEHDAWLHVDAAHGGAALMSSRHRHLLEGIDRADSLIWDAHKMMFVPALCAFVLYKNAAHKFETFRQDAPYLFDPSAPGLADYDSGMRTVECTKRAAAFGLWGMWSLLGPTLFEDLVDVTFDLGRQFYEQLAAAPDFEPLHEPECNILVFRHLPESLRDATAEEIGRFQLDLRRRLIESGEFYIVSTKIDGIGALRLTIINPLTTGDHLQQLLDALRKYGRTLR